MSDNRMPAIDWRYTDRLLGIPDDKGLARIAEKWNANKKPDQGRPGIVEDHRLVGLYGERAFARTFRIKMDLKMRRHGSRRHNFKLRNGMTVDVVTRRLIRGVRRPELAVPANTIGNADIWVLVLWHGPEYEPEFLGWITERKAIEHGRRVQFHEKGVPNIVVDHLLLCPIARLEQFARVPVDVFDQWFDDRAAELAALKTIDQAATPAKKTVPPPADTGQTKLW